MYNNEHCELKVDTNMNEKNIEILCDYKFPIDHITFRDFCSDLSLSENEDYLIKRYNSMKENLKPDKHAKQSNAQIIKLISNDNTESYLFWIVKDSQFKIFHTSYLKHISFSKYGEVIGILIFLT